VPPLQSIIPIYAWVTAFTDYLIRGQNMYAKPRTEMPMKRYGQKTNAQCRCLRRLGLEFGGVPTAVTRIGTIVYAKSGNHAIRQFAAITAGFPRQWRILALPD